MGVDRPPFAVARALLGRKAPSYDQTALSFEKGCLIHVVHKHENGLWEGYVVDAGERTIGHFPFTMVEALPREKWDETVLSLEAAYVRETYSAEGGQISAVGSFDRRPSPIMLAGKGNPADAYKAKTRVNPMFGAAKTPSPAAATTLAPPAAPAAAASSSGSLAEVESPPSLQTPHRSGGTFVRVSPCPVQHDSTELLPTAPASGPTAVATTAPTVAALGGGNIPVGGGGPSMKPLPIPVVGAHRVPPLQPDQLTPTELVGSPAPPSPHTPGGSSAFRRVGDGRGRSFSSFSQPVSRASSEHA
jgi:hypothetical protein